MIKLTICIFALIATTIETKAQGAFQIQNNKIILTKSFEYGIDKGFDKPIFTNQILIDFKTENPVWYGKFEDIAKRTIQNKKASSTEIDFALVIAYQKLRHSIVVTNYTASEYAMYPKAALSADTLFIYNAKICFTNLKINYMKGRQLLGMTGEGGEIVNAIWKRDKKLDIETMNAEMIMFIPVMLGLDWVLLDFTNVEKLVNQSRFAKNNIDVEYQKAEGSKLDSYNGTKLYGCLGWDKMTEAEIMKNFEIIAKAGVLNAMTKDYSYLTRPSAAKIDIDKAKKAFGDD